MRINEIITEIKSHSATEWLGRTIDDATTRDQVIFGSPNQECTGVAVCIYPSIEVIQRAAELHCNFIVTHEALFWNHGDRTDWLAGNSAFEAKRDLLERQGMCVWRDHDHLHAGVTVANVLRDGIFYGIAERLGWVAYMDDSDAYLPQKYRIPACTGRELGQTLVQTFGLKNIRCVGNLDSRIENVLFPMHISGRPAQDDPLITQIAEEDINALIAMEAVDFTVSSYMRDAASLGEDRCMFEVGHFNVEQAGMAWYAAYLHSTFGEAVPVHMVSIDDMYRFVTESSQPAAAF